MNRSNRLWQFALAAVLALTACTTTHIARVEPNSYTVIDTVATASPEVEALIAPYKQKLDAEMNQIIGYSSEPMRKAQPESVLGNWLADLLHEQAEEYLGEPVDFAVLNYGGVRIPEIPAGEVSRGKIFELMPFDNRVLVLFLDGETVVQLVNHMADRGGWPVSEPLRYEIVEEQAQNITLGGNAIQAEQTYRVAMPDYIANGGDDCTFLIDKKRTDLNKLLRDAIIEYVREQTAQGEQLGATVDGRVRVGSR